ncbi:unnamed protein product [Rotaria sp. Silwood1]|nr:unnamed protein product [Rotaria sp. Silwood1]
MSYVSNKKGRYDIQRLSFEVDRSVTTTNDDRNIVNYLQPIANISDIETYANKLFEAKSDLTGFTTQQILLLDYKTSVFNNQIWGIGVAETWHPSYLLEHQDDLLQEMAKEKTNSNLTGILFSIIDILKEKNLMLIPGEPENTVIRAAFNVDVVDQIADLGPRMSRKKQIIPPLEEYFKNNP